MNKPQPDEYAGFNGNYIDMVEDGAAFETLERSKDNSYNFFSTLSDDQANHAYAEGKWSIKEVLGHMIDAERTFAYRILCFSRGQKELPGFDENEYVQKATFRDRDIKDLAEEFRLVRESNLYLFKSLSPQQLTATGIANGNKISVRALLYITAGHELHHHKVIKENYLK
jgi:uncharacterized damage-inducible protein DinB